MIQNFRGEIEMIVRRSEQLGKVALTTGDETFPVKWAYHLRDLIPGAKEVVEVDGARLFFPEERPGDLVGVRDAEHGSHQVKAVHAGEGRRAAPRTRPAARALGPSLRDTRPFLRQTTPVIRDQLRPFARASLPAIRELRPAAHDLVPADRAGAPCACGPATVRSRCGAFSSVWRQPSVMQATGFQACQSRRT